MILYILIALLTIGALAYATGRGYITNDVDGYWWPAQIITGLFWPIGLPIILIVLGYKYLVKLGEKHL